MNYQLPYSDVFHIVSFEKVLCIKVDGEEHYFFTSEKSPCGKVHLIPPLLLANKGGW